MDVQCAMSKKSLKKSVSENVSMCVSRKIKKKNKLIQKSDSSRWLILSKSLLPDPALIRIIEFEFSIMFGFWVMLFHVIPLNYLIINFF